MYHVTKEGIETGNRGENEGSVHGGLKVASGFIAYEQNDSHCRDFSKWTL